MPTPRIPPQYGHVVDVAFNMSDFQFHHRSLADGSRPYKSDLFSTLARARARGVVGVLALGTSVDDSEMGIQWLLAAQAMQLTPPFCAASLRSPPPTLLPAVGCTIGVHPTRAKSLILRGGRVNQPLLARLAASVRAAAAGGLLAAIGEVGLDDVRKQHCPPAVQRRAFAAQLDALIPAAREGFAAAGRPDRLPSLLLHVRGDDTTTDAFLAELLPRRASYAGGIVHSFTSSAATAARLLAAGFYIGVDGITPREEGGYEALLTVPLSRIVVETDAPYCAIRASNVGLKAAIAANGGVVPPALSEAMRTYPEVAPERYSALPIEAAVAAAAAAVTAGATADIAGQDEDAAGTAATSGAAGGGASVARAVSKASAAATCATDGGFTAPAGAAEAPTEPAGISERPATISLSAALAVFDPSHSPHRATATSPTAARPLALAPFGGIAPNAGHVAWRGGVGSFARDERVNNDLRKAAEATTAAFRSGAAKAMRGRVEPSYTQAVVELLCCLHPEAKVMSPDAVRGVLLENTIAALGL